MTPGETRARELVQKTLSYAASDEVRVEVAGGRSANTRFALNGITTSGDEDTLTVTVTAYSGRRHASASTSEVDEDSLRRVVKSAEDLARVSPEDPEYVPELGPQKYLDVHPYFESTARATAETRVQGALSAVTPAGEKDLVAAGFFEHDDSFHAIGNTKGLTGSYPSTNASFSATIRARDGRSSGWGGDSSRRIEQVDYAAASARAIRKAQGSAEPRTVEPGAHPVILEPQAVADFLRFAVFSLAARLADEGRSFYARPGGGNKVGDRIFKESITMRTDPTHPEILGAPFAADGLPAKPMVWIEKGVLRNLSYDRYWAQKKGKEATGNPTSLVFEGGRGSLEDLVRDTDRAVLVTRFWYIRSLDPRSLLLTGLTRDGTFWVEKGKVKHAIKNFRFNESPIAVLNQVTGLSSPVRVEGSMLPAVRAKAFTFSSLSDAV